jgi:excinuclease ABC subunit B
MEYCRARVTGSTYFFAVVTHHRRQFLCQPQNVCLLQRSGNAILAFLDVSRRLNAQDLETVFEQVDDLPLEDIPVLIQKLEAQMKEAAKNLEFEEAGKLRDRIKQLREKLVGRHSTRE